MKKLNLTTQLFTAVAAFIISLLSLVWGLVTLSAMHFIISLVMVIATGVILTSVHNEIIQQQQTTRSSSLQRWRR